MGFSVCFSVTGRILHAISFIASWNFHHVPSLRRLNDAKIVVDEFWAPKKAKEDDENVLQCIGTKHKIKETEFNFRRQKKDEKKI